MIKEIIGYVAMGFGALWMVAVFVCGFVHMSYVDHPDIRHEMIGDLLKEGKARTYDEAGAMVDATAAVFKKGITVGGILAVANIAVGIALLAF